MSHARCPFVTDRLDRSSLYPSSALSYRARRHHLLLEMLLVVTNAPVPPPRRLVLADHNVLGYLV